MGGSGRKIGLAVVGCGAVGRIRATIARDYPGIEWIGLCDINKSLADKLAADIEADFVTTDYNELIERPEVDAVIIATAVNYHYGPSMAAAMRGLSLFIEKPLAADVRESQAILSAIQKCGVDAAVGYTERFRRRYLSVKEKISSGEIGDVHTVVTRAFMNRLVPMAVVGRAADKELLTPMVVSGTHYLDLSLWLMGNKKPVTIYARSVEKDLSGYGTKDTTVGLFTMEDGSLFSMNICWSLPVHWPGAGYGHEVGLVGTKGVIDIDDTHRDLVLASDIPQISSYRADGYDTEFERHVNFLNSYPPGDISQGQFWGPMREETNSWFARLCKGMETPHATAADGHNILLLCRSMDLSAKLQKSLPIPIPLEDFYL